MTKTTDEKTDGRKVIEALERSAAEKQRHRRTETPQKQTEDDNETKAKRAFKNLTGEEEFNLRRSLSLRAILGGDILAGAWFRRHFLVYCDDHRHVSPLRWQSLCVPAANDRRDAFGRHAARQTLQGADALRTIERNDTPQQRRRASG